MSVVTRKAVVLLETFTKGLADGVKHYDESGKELKTVKEILETLQKEGTISIRFPDADKPLSHGILPVMGSKVRVRR